MDTKEFEGTNATKPDAVCQELKKQKQLFCQMLLLEIQKYESAVQKVKSRPIDDGKHDDEDEEQVF